MKKLGLLMLTCVFTALFSFAAFAGSWSEGANGWMWTNDDGTHPKNTWQWCDGDLDGISECFYFDKNGVCLQDTTTPDGYKVNEYGEWVVDGVVQKSTTNGQNAIRNTAYATTNPSDVGINIGTTLNSAVNALHANGVNYQSEDGMLYYFDSYGWYHIYTFDGNGKCIAVTFGIRGINEADANTVFEGWKSELNYRVVDHTKSDTAVSYTYKDNAGYSCTIKKERESDGYNVYMIID